jgi:hypothetical protein
MATSPYERLKLGGLELNGADFEIEDSFSFEHTRIKPQFAANADASGEVLVREPMYTNSGFKFTVRVVRPGDAAYGTEAWTEEKEEVLAKLGELTDALTQCGREEGGSPLLWIPADLETEYTAKVLVAEYEEIPISVTGEAGWFINMPAVKVALTCAPFLEKTERQVLAATESGAEPLQVLYVGGIGGDVPAKARMIVKDKSSQDRRTASWGHDIVSSESNPSLLLSASSGLSGTGFSGESKTRSGAYGSEKVLRGTAVSQATTICGTGRIAHVGSFGITLRVYATSEASLFRIAYKNGDGSLTKLEWKEPTVVNGWDEISMGEIFLDAVELGTQTSEIRVEQKATEGNPANDVNYIEMLPTGVAAATARGIASNTATNLIAYDNFEQTEGNLEGKKPNYPTSGVEWAETNKTGENGFKVNASHYLERKKKEDASLSSGCFALLGTTSYESFVSSCVIRDASYVGETKSIDAGAFEGVLLGLLGRYVSTTKWIVAGITGITANRVLLQVQMNVSGTVSVLEETTISASSGILDGAHALSFSVDATGNWSAEFRGARLTGYSSALAPGGVLASGRAGLYDANTSPTEGARIVDSFQLLGGEKSGVVCYSGKQAEFNSQGCLRQDSTAEYDGEPSSYRGGNLYLMPAGESERINRIAVKMRRNDVAAEESASVTDKHTTEILVTERFILPR